MGESSSACNASICAFLSSRRLSSFYSFSNARTKKDVLFRMPVFYGRADLSLILSNLDSNYGSFTALSCKTLAPINDYL